MMRSAMRGLKAAAVLIPLILAGCGAGSAYQRAEVLDDIEFTQTGPDTAKASMDHMFYTGGGFHQDWPWQRAHLVKKIFIEAVAQEAQRRGKPYFQLIDLDDRARAHALSDGFRMYRITTTVKITTDIRFFDAEPKGEKQGVFRTASVLAGQTEPLVNERK